jgi:hypothetical protein
MESLTGIGCYYHLPSGVFIVLKGRTVDETGRSDVTTKQQQKYIKKLKKSFNR